MFPITYKRFFTLHGSQLCFASDSVVKCMKIVVKSPLENDYIVKINNISVFYPKLARLKEIKNTIGLVLTKFNLG